MNGTPELAGKDRGAHLSAPSVLFYYVQFCSVLFSSLLFFSVLFQFFLFCISVRVGQAPPSALLSKLAEDEGLSIWRAAEGGGGRMVGWLDGWGLEGRCLTQTLAA